MGLSHGVAAPEPLTRWSAWTPLAGAGKDRRLPAAPGLYQIRRVGSGALDYVSQTGLTLRARLGMLDSVYKPQMPYRDPHTAAPALWALRDCEGCNFEVSVTVVEGTVVERKALEAVAITLYRLEAGRSPTANFGRMPVGYRASTGNNAQLVAAGRRDRGGRDPTALCTAPSVPVAGALGGKPHAADWMGWSWWGWVAVSEVFGSAGGAGLYRLRIAVSCNGGLLYVGEGNIAARLRAHVAKATRHGHRQRDHFSGELEASWVELPGVATVNLLEHENDLVASHVLDAGHAPRAQFLG